MNVLAASSSPAGIVTASASVLTALALVITSVTVLIPQLRKLNGRVEAQDQKLDVIHALVNSTLTASIQAELDATMREIAVMTEVIQLRSQAGSSPAPETTAALARSRDRVKVLALELEDRKTQAEALARRRTAYPVG